MEVEGSSSNDTEKDAPYLRDPRDTEDTKTDTDACTDDMDADYGNSDDDDSDDESEESAAGSLDLEGPLVTPAI